MKKLLSNRLFIFIIGGVFFASVTLYAANVYYANSIKYTPTDSSWNVTNVNDALNNLYSMKTELDTIKGIGDATAGDIASGKTAVVKGEKVTGTKTGDTNYKVYEFNNVSAIASDNYHATYKDDAWVPITYAQYYDCSDGSCSEDNGVDFAIDIGFTPKRIVTGEVCLTVGSATKNSYYNIRLTRGYTANSSTNIYWYINKLCGSITQRHNNIDTENNDTKLSSWGYNYFYTQNKKLYFKSDWYRYFPNSESAVKVNSGYQVYGTLFYLSGTIVYEE